MPSHVEDPCRATPRVHAAPNRGSVPRYVKPYTVWPGPRATLHQNPLWRPSSSSDAPKKCRPEKQRKTEEMAKPRAKLSSRLPQNHRTYQGFLLGGSCVAASMKNIQILMKPLHGERPGNIRGTSFVGNPWAKRTSIARLFEAKTQSVGNARCVPSKEFHKKNRIPHDFGSRILFNKLTGANPWGTLGDGRKNSFKNKRAPQREGAGGCGILTRPSQTWA